MGILCEFRFKFNSLQMMMITDLSPYIVLPCTRTIHCWEAWALGENGVFWITSLQTAVCFNLEWCGFLVRELKYSMLSMRLKLQTFYCGYRYFDSGTGFLTSQMHIIPSQALTFLKQQNYNFWLEMVLSSTFYFLVFLIYITVSCSVSSKFPFLGGFFLGGHLQCSASPAGAVCW